MTSVNDIREGFLSWFEANGHERTASAPLVPDSDPTLLFVNAGMVPFKNIFTGHQAPFAPRAVSSQKCLRAGGKHNDLDNVGYTARHHTFFEMLGNFSFGDYFKERAITQAWSVLTDLFGLDPDKLLVTVYHDDDEAAALWKKVSGFADDRILRIATADNFWSMGDSGPCGPCSEIFFDHGEDVPGGPPGSADEDGDRFIEIWNLVFMQYDQTEGEQRTPLPKPSIDTGMGLERIAAVLQGVHNNYDTDLFQSLIIAAEQVYGRKADPHGDALGSFRVIADHMRAAGFLLADGVTPSNEGRGYVLRRIMRRAMRHGHLLGAEEPSMHKLTPALIAEMGAAFPELERAEDAIAAGIEQEESRFQDMLGRGISLLDDAVEGLEAGATLDGRTAFTLYDTYGFPADLTADILRGRGLSFDRNGFDRAMAEQKAKSKGAGFNSGDSGKGAAWLALHGEHGDTRFQGYDATTGQGTLLAILQDGAPVDELSDDAAAELLFDATPFYAESGGQAGDHGEIRFDNGARFVVRDTRKPAGGMHAHHGYLAEGTVRSGDRATLSVDAGRRERVMGNHSATHLLHAALRRILGGHVTQKGSLVEENKLRFDFSHGGALSEAELEAVEREVNHVIRQNRATDIKLSSPDAAIEAGAVALFGEKYGDEVRVLTMGADPSDDASAYSVELCGGTHVERTGDIGLFVITSESGVSAGVRRIEAATGDEALGFLRGRARIAEDLAARLKVPLGGLEGKVGALQDERRQLERELSEAKRALAMSGGSGPAADSGPEDIGGTAFIGRVAEGVGGKDLRTLVDEAKDRLGSGVAAFVGTKDGKAAIAVGITKDLTERLSAVDLVKAAVAEVGGKGGGGRPDMAQAGGPDASGAPAAVDAVRKALKG